MAVNIGPRIGIDGEAEYRKQINNIIQQTRTLESEYEKLASAGDKQNTTLKQNAELHKVLAQQIEVQKERVKELAEMVKQSSEKFGENDTKTLKWKEALNQAETELNNLQTKLKELPSNIELVGQKMEDMGKKIKSVGDGMTSLGHSIAPVSAAAAAGLTASAKSFMDFESGMSKVAAISGATGEDLESLTEKAKEMGATTKFSATESTEAFSYMAMAGWKAEQMLAGIAPVMNLAAASGEELSLTSDIVTDALTAFGLKAEDASEFADVLAAASANANTNVAMMGESFKYAAPVAGSMGYSIQDVALALGLMANNGIKADMAGTALRNMIIRMAKPTNESADAMDRLNLSLADEKTGKMYTFREIMDQLRASFGAINMPLDEFNREVNSLSSQLADGEITEKKYQKALEELVKEAYGAEAAEKARAAAMLAGTRAMPGLLAIVNSTAEDYQKLSVAIDSASEPMARLADGSIVSLNEALASGQEVIETYSGSAEQMARIMQENTAGAWVEAKSAMEGAAIEAGEVLAPYLKMAADEVKELARWFSSLDQETQNTIVQTAALVAAAAPLLITGGKVVSGIGSLTSAGGGLLQMIGKMVPSIGTASAAMSTAGTSATAASAGIAGIAAPAAAAVAAVGLLTSAFVTAYKNDDEFAKKVDEDWAEIQKDIQDTINVIAPAWKKFSEGISPVFTSAMESIDRRIDIFKTGFQGAIDIVGGIVNGDWRRICKGFEEIGTSTWNSALEAVRSTVSAIEGVFNRMDIHFPHIKLPHFYVRSTDGWGLPDIGIDWYAKAMQSGMRLTNATVFGASGGKLLAGGEAGNEWVVGENSILNMIQSAVRTSIGYLPEGGNTVTIGDTQIIINATPDQDIEELADMVDEIITSKYEQARAAWA